MRLYGIYVLKKTYHSLGGIDEAGYGPTLGPLVVSCFSLHSIDTPPPENFAHENLYELLAPIIKNKSTRRAKPPRPLFIADSKKVHAQSFSELERGALSLLANCLPPAALKTDAKLLNTLYPDIDLTKIKWYATEPSNLPIIAEHDDVQTASASLAHIIKEARLKIGINSKLITAKIFNSELTDATNKADLLAANVMSLASNLISSPALHLIVDRLGGRAYYTPMLQKAFSTRTIKEITRSPKLSEYLLQDTKANKSAQIEFACNGESKSMLVAAASLVSKYVREILMTRLNNYFRLHAPELTPTKGYPQDAIRFLRETDQLRNKLKISDADLIRSR